MDWKKEELAEAILVLEIAHHSKTETLCQRWENFPGDKNSLMKSFFDRRASLPVHLEQLSEEVCKERRACQAYQVTTKPYVGGE